VRNSRLKFQINLSSAPVTGNSPAYYSVKYNGTEYNGTLTGNVITISNFSSIPDSSTGSTNDRTFTSHRGKATSLPLETSAKRTLPSHSMRRPRGSRI